MNYGWNRAHFGAWCVISSPLILGLDLTQTAVVAEVIDVITNHEVCACVQAGVWVPLLEWCGMGWAGRRQRRRFRDATQADTAVLSSVVPGPRQAIAVNQAWAGHPGGLVWSGLGGALGFPAARACSPNNPGLKQSGWALKPIAGSADGVVLSAPGGGCLKQQGAGFEGGAGGLIIAECNTTDPAQAFAYNATTLQLKQPSSRHCVDVHAAGPIVWMYGCTPGANDKLALNETTGTITVTLAAGHPLCFGVEAGDPAGATYASTLQAWAKPLEAGVAVLMINPDTSPHEFQVRSDFAPRVRVPAVVGRSTTCRSRRRRPAWD